jgi:hypothetical protein
MTPDVAIRQSGLIPQVSRPTQGSTRAPKQRTRLTRKRQSLRMDLCLDSYAKLKRLAAKHCDAFGQPASLVSVIEQLIRSADEVVWPEK